VDEHAALAITQSFHREMGPARYPDDIVGDIVGDVVGEIGGWLWWQKRLVAETFGGRNRAAGG
jgi:hypothetical protein